MVRCPVQTGKKHMQTIESCLMCAGGADAMCQFTQAILLAMFADESRDGIHVSDLLICPRQAILKKQLNFSINPTDYWHAFRGKMSHLIIELASGKGRNLPEKFKKIVEDSPKITNELSLSMKIDDTIIKGRIDEYVEDLELIRDYKSTTKVPTWNRPYTNHSQQINIYISLLETNKYKVKKAQVVYFDMHDARKIDCPIMPKVERVEMIKRRLSFYKQSVEDVNNSITEREWACNYCAPEISDECLKIDIRNGLSKSKFPQEDIDNFVNGFKELRKQL